MQSGPVPPQLHEPVMHTSPESQAVPQMPQFPSSVSRFTHAEPQQVSGASQSGPITPHLQYPLTQNSPVSHEVAQSPQCVIEVLGL